MGRVASPAPGQQAGGRVWSRRSVLPAIAVGLAAGRAAAQGFEGGFAGAGSTFVHPLIARWGQVFTSLQGEGGGGVSVDGGLDYEPVGSLGGVLRVASGAVEFGATDVPLTPAELARLDLIQFPIVSGGIAVIVNAGVSRIPLRLTGEAVAQIFLGGIARWTHPALREANPDAGLPDTPIAVIHREDGSGSTWNFAAFLARASADWRQQVGVDQQLRWPVGTGARGSRELAERVRATPGAIGFVEAGQAARSGLNAVLIRNAAGAFVAPTAANLQHALAGTAWEPARHFHAAGAEPQGAEAYPVTATAFALMQRRPASRTRARRATEFFRMALTERAEDATALGYVPLPAPTVQQVLAYWRNPPR